jgi:hypothetical protein
VVVEVLVVLEIRVDLVAVEAKTLIPAVLVMKVVFLQ